MIITDKDKMLLEPFTFDHGKNSYFCKTLDTEGNPILLKFFYGTEEEIKRKIKIIKPFKKIVYPKINAFPKDTISIDDEEVGYFCNYFKESKNFLESRNMPYSLKWKSTLDTVEQLKFLHKNGYIVNDIRLSNHMICPINNCGFLVDFEDMIHEENTNMTPAYYRFYKKEYTGVLKPSKQEDIKKQLISHLSLLLEENFEQFVIIKDEWELLKKFKFQKELYEFMETVLKEEDILYFDEIASLFEKEEVVKEYQKILKKQTLDN